MDLNRFGLVSGQSWLGHRVGRVLCTAACILQPNRAGLPTQLTANKSYYLYFTWSTPKFSIITFLFTFVHILANFIANNAEIYIFHLFVIKFISSCYSSCLVVIYQVYFNNLDITNVYTPGYMRQKLFVPQHRMGYKTSKDYSSVFRWHAHFFVPICNYGFASSKV
jgi:hypothetical protein